MSDASGDESLARLAAELARSLRRLQRELEPRSGRPRPPTPRELLRFTDEVAIPALVLVLETNVRALRLLQRAIRIAEGRDPRGDRTAETAVRERAVAVSRTTLDKLDSALADVQEAIEGRPPDDEARQLLGEVRELRDDIDDRLAAEAAESDPLDDVDPGVPVDVDAELKSIKDDLDDGTDDQPDDKPDE